ncbi:hypothetical protein BDK89_3542 [Ilumatobacter fluminis]|uniref:SalK n=1 Tax=Ilumatobacter fluminis TaxID=467091 RepID=A0A4R7I4N7_9ACTN|nr:hypothetical protein [Ilumatobacter fluminis]TDT17929.1 hypothetical protein BDK89_3542 [Ilumatobacter fluminis]
MGSSTLSAHARRLGGALEPVIGQVYFAPECHERYVELGFGPSPGEFNGVAGPDGPAYFTSRGSLLGQVPGQVVAAAFGVFNPDVVVPSVAQGWTLTDASTICAARDAGALAHLERHLGAAPDGLAAVGDALERAAASVRVEGRALTAGITALSVPDHPFGRVFRFGDLLREFRGDSHIASWVTADLDAVEIGLLTELYWGLPLRSYARTRGWSGEQFDAGEESLRSKGLIDDAGFTDAGRQLRERVETDTDRQMASVVASFGDDLDEVLTVLEAWGTAVRAGHGYPASGPHDLARTR